MGWDGVGWGGAKLNGGAQFKERVGRVVVSVTGGPFLAVAVNDRVISSDHLGQWGVIDSGASERE